LAILDRELLEQKVVPTPNNEIQSPQSSAMVKSDAFYENLGHFPSIKTPLSQSMRKHLPIKAVMMSP